MLLLLLSLTAFAQDTVSGGEIPNLNGQIFRPAVDSSGLLWTSETAVEREAPLTGRFLMSYVNDPVVYLDGNDQRTELISSIWQLDLLGAWSWRALRLGVDAPIYLRSSGDITGGETGIGDVALDLRGTFLNRAEAPVGLALAGRVSLPTADMEAPLGNDGLSWDIEAIADAELGDRGLVAFNLGTRGVPGVTLENLAYNDQLVARLGGAYALSDASGVGAELISHLTWGAMSNPAGRPIEAMVSGWHSVQSDWKVRGGVGRGLNSGIGASNLRIVAALAYEPPRTTAPVPVLDADADGVLDDADACAAEAEDRDGVADADGCPEPTRVTVVAVNPEGQPVPGATFSLGDHTGNAGEPLALYGGQFALTGVAPGHDQAAVSMMMIPDAEVHEVRLTLKPTPVPMGRLRVSAVDSAGSQVESATWNAVGKDAHGKAGEIAELLPGEWTVAVSAPGYKEVRRTLQITANTEEIVQLTLEPSKVVVTAERIDLKDSVYFETNKAIIKAMSFAMLDEIAQIMVNHPELLKVKVEGHTDSRGNDAYNKDLSARRAAAVVEYLASKGVARERLASEGFGEERPLDTANNAAAWEKNRRVDFFVLERAN